MPRLFGTDGIRGTPGQYPLTDEMIAKVGTAAAMHLLRHNPRKKKQLQVLIGKDTRSSCDKIEKILAGSITACGIDVSSAGSLPTPGLAFLTGQHKADMGVMISASHNKASDNGIKFFSHSGHKMSEAHERQVEAIIFNELAGKSQPAHRHNAGSFGILKDAARTYIDFLKSKAAGLDLSGLSVVVDNAYGAASSIAPVLFKELGMTVYSTNDKPDGHNINHNCGALHPEGMAALVKKHKASIGFAYDGDADRVILADEKGTLLDGDYIMAIIGLFLMNDNRLPEKTVVTTVMSNYGLQEAIESAGGKLIRTDVGDRNVTETLVKYNLVLGGEQSGHIVLLNHSTTGDALLTSLKILKVIKQSGKKLSALSKCMKKSPQVLINVKVKERKPFEEMPLVKEKLAHFTEKLKHEGRVLLRYSGTEALARVMVEGRNKDLIENVANSLAQQIRDEIGVDSV